MGVLDLSDMEVLTVAMKYTYCLGMCHHRLRYIGANISEEPAASIFRVE
jgi:hypothetical protein